MSYRSEMKARVLGESAQQILGGRIRVGDRVHAGLAQKGGAGFQGVVDRVEGNFVYVNIGTDKFGDRIIKAPLKTVMKEAALSEGKDFAIVVVDPDGGSPSWKRGGQGHTAVPKVVWQMHSLASHELKDAVELARDKYPKLNVSIENKSGRIVRVLKPGEKLPSKLTESEQISCPSCHRKVDKDAGWCRHCKQDITESEQDTVNTSASGSKSYENYFLKKLKVAGYASVRDIPDNKKSAFFKDVDSNWTAENEETDPKAMSSCPYCHRRYLKIAGYCPHCKQDITEGTDDDSIRRRASIHWSRETRYYEPGPYNNGFLAAKRGENHPPLGSAAFQAGFDAGKKSKNEAYSRNHDGEWHVLCKKCKHEWYQSSGPTRCPKCKAERRYLEKTGSDTVNEASSLFGKGGAWGPAVGKAVSKWGNSRFTEAELEKVWKVANKYPNDAKREYALRCVDELKELGRAKFKDADSLLSVKIPSGLAPMVAKGIRNNLEDALMESTEAVGKPKAPSETDRLKVSQAQELIAVKMRQSLSIMAAKLRDVANKSREQQVKLNAPKGTAHSS